MTDEIWGMYMVVFQIKVPKIILYDMERYMIEHQIDFNNFHKYNKMWKRAFALE
jgi:hypothetical protein